ncbi:hydrogenase expression/formation protein HypE [Dethiosulfovibrio peptidovorans DSM 11002]|uniref:Hydrogenase expression/formation protein HypE n=1 Tax=Dethiosulfovibrio peptidovorans DSM 11002 TaxID=469381 RepID=D2Z2K3_9BACT|nr:hydrogenase expression/formation protein HypE [Dethiosulfovibrio peptidovorans]EFC90159.1 hydrogenase expression/formation protein HypE [Dethiosulfovibrio peptidovorans DSM 11002]
MGKLNLGQGSGGRLTSELIGKFKAQFDDVNVQRDLEDCTMISPEWAVTIDGFTVSPMDFPGGNIGKLAICGGTNDLAVRGIEPKFVTLSVIAEEGLDEEELLRYGRSAASVCHGLEVKLAAGDTKVVPKGTVDGLFLTVASMGQPLGKPLGMDHIKPGDRLAVTTSIGRHGATIGSIRFDLNVEGLSSDCAPLWPLVKPLAVLPGVRAMRDCTRGGLGTTLCEWAEGTGLGIEIDESSIPIDEEVSSVCDILGFDPLHLACEGCALIAYSPDDEDRIIEILRAHPSGIQATSIGTVVEGHPSMVGMRTKAGGMRVVDMPVGELLPRIC